LENDINNKDCDLKKIKGVKGQYSCHVKACLTLAGSRKVT